MPRRVARNSRPPVISMAGMDRPRIAPVAAQPAAAPSPVVAEIARAIGVIGEGVRDMRDAHGRRIEDLERRLDGVNTHISAARMHIGGATLPGLPGADRSAAMVQMQKFLRECVNQAPSISAAMTTDNNPDGGYLVGETIENAIGQILYESSPMRQVCGNAVITMGSTYRATDWISMADAQWAGEKTVPQQTDMSKLAELVFEAHEIYAMPAATQQMIEDSKINVAESVAAQLQLTFSTKEGTAFMRGDGSGKPAGLIGGFYQFVSTGDATRDWGKFQYIASGDASGFIATAGANSPVDSLIATVAALKSPYQGNARWMMNANTAAVVRKWKDLEGRFIWQDSVQAGQPSTLLGFPVSINPDCDDVGADKLPILFGDFRRGYLIVDKLGMTVLPDRYTQKPYVLFWTRKRVGGGARDFHAIKAVKCASS